MAKINIDPITSQFASVEALNLRFQQIENEFNDKVLYRFVEPGVDNTMNVPLDMGDQGVINVGESGFAGPNGLVRHTDLLNFTLASVEHGDLSGLDQDDHPQYLKRTELDNGLSTYGVPHSISAGGVQVTHEGGQGYVQCSPYFSNGGFIGFPLDTTYYSVGEELSGEGGAVITGLGINNAVGITFRAFAQAPYDVIGAKGVIHFDVDGYDAYSFFPLTGNDIAFSISTNGGTSPLFTLRGDGSAITHGGIRPSAGSDALSVYEEDSFVPVLTGSVSGGSPIYAVQKGLFTRIGRMVKAQGTIVTTAVTGISGNLSITGLPYLSNSEAGLVQVGSVITNRGAAMSVSLQPNSNVLSLVSSTSNASITHAALAASSSISFEISYMV